MNPGRAKDLDSGARARQDLGKAGDSEARPGDRLQELAKKVFDKLRCRIGWEPLALQEKTFPPRSLRQIEDSEANHDSLDAEQYERVLIG